MPVTATQQRQAPQQRQAIVSSLAHEILSFPDLPAGTEIECTMLPSAPRRAREPKILRLHNGMVFGTQPQSSNLRINYPDGQVFYYHSGGELKYAAIRDSSFATPGAYLKGQDQNTQEPKVFFYGSNDLQGRLANVGISSTSQRRVMQDRDGNLFVKEQCILDEVAPSHAREEEQRKAAIYGNIAGKQFSGFVERKCMIEGQLTSVAETIFPYHGPTLDLVLRDDEQPLTLEARVALVRNTLVHFCLLQDGSLSKDKQPVIHGNLNLENISVDPENLHISFSGYTPEYHPTLSGYVAPELMDRSRGLMPSFATEVYALGAVFKGSSSEELRAARRAGGLATFRTLKSGILKYTPQEWEGATPKARQEYTQLLELSQKMMEPDPLKRPDLDTLKMSCGLFSPQTLAEIVQLVQHTCNFYNTNESRKKSILGRFFGQNLVQLPQDILHPKNITQFRTDLAEFCGNPKTPGEFTRLLLDSLSQRPELADLLCLQDSIVPDTPRSVEGSSDLDGEVVATVRRRKEAPTARSLFNPFGSSRRPESVVPMTSMPDEHAFSA